ncbi:hypothetical protein QBC39DRAFT_360332 [Podospora conica]|nr:hypothetical protein QBC39DRAFT_360332 [Schizothecium conicum]
METEFWQLRARQLQRFWRHEPPFPTRETINARDLALAQYMQPEFDVQLENERRWEPNWEDSKRSLTSLLHRKEWKQLLARHAERCAEAETAKTPEIPGADHHDQPQLALAPMENLSLETALEAKTPEIPLAHDDQQQLALAPPMGNLSLDTALEAKTPETPRAHDDMQQLALAPGSAENLPLESAHERKPAKMRKRGKDMSHRQRAELPMETKSEAPTATASDSKGVEGEQERGMEAPPTEEDRVLLDFQQYILGKLRQRER